MKKSNYTYHQLIVDANKKYQNQAVNMAILLHLSPYFNTTTDLMIHRNNLVDFDINNYFSLLEDYYEHSKPLAQIIHSAKFNDLELNVHPMIHTPRNETELMAKTIQTILMGQYQYHHILDLCAGSGNIGISIKYHFPYLQLTLLDTDADAVTNIKDNLNKFKIQADVIHEDFFKFIEQDHTPKFDVICMNPPYVSADELDSRMMKYEKKISFINSSSPLDFYDSLFKNLNHLVSSNHFLIACEFGYNQKSSIQKLVQQYHLAKFTTFFKDLNGIDRFFIIQK